MHRPPFSTRSRRLALATLVLTSQLAAPAMAYPAYQLNHGELVIALTPVPKPVVPAAKVRVAVVDFKTIGAQADFGEAVAENLRNALVSLKSFTVVERGQIEKALKEANFSQSGLVEGQQAITLGKLLGAKVIVVGSVTKIGSTYTVNARFIDVQTGEATDAKSFKTDDEDRIAQIVDQLALALSGRTGGEMATATPDPAAEAITVKTGKSKLLASSLSFLLPGVGQFYAGNVGMGLAEAGLNLAGLGGVWAGQLANDNAIVGLGAITMIVASVWSGLDGWFTTEEEVGQNR